MNIWLAGLIGAALGAAIVFIITLLRRGATMSQLADLRSRSAMLDEQIAERRAEIESLRDDRERIDTMREEAERRAAQIAEQLNSKQQQFDEQKQLLAEAEKKLTDTFSAVGSKALAANNEQFMALAKKTLESFMVEAKGDVEKKQQAIDAMVKPIRELLEKQNTAVQEIEKKREGAYKSIEQQIKHISESHHNLNQQTGKLVTALRRPEQRGRWGEMALRNVVETAGMTAHCDFNEQVQTDDPNTRDRPDMTINLPGGGVIVVDSKVALDAYLDALDRDSPEDRAACLSRHAKQTDTHVKQLASKKYWDQFERTPQLVVMFVRLESALMSAFEHRPDLHAEAMQKHVLIATPTLLVALLQAVAYGWQQESVAENAREISKTGRELYDRLSTFASHLSNVGKRLNSATDAYNKSVGSLERSVLPSARKLQDLHVTTGEELSPPDPVEIETREITADELRLTGA